MDCGARRRLGGFIFVVVLVGLLFFVTAAAAEIEVFFSPEEGEEILAVLVTAIEAAEERVYILMYSFTLGELAEALIAKYGEGVDVKVIMDRSQAGPKWAVDEKLADAGVPVLRLGGSNGGSMHIKMMVVDDVVVTGSYNWSGNAVYRNDENLLVIKDEEKILEAHLEKFRRLWKGGRGGFKK